MWSSKLKRRPSLTSAIGYFNSLDGLNLRVYTETNLQGHDLAIPIPYHPRSDSTPPSGPQQRWLRCLILTPSMVQPAEALDETIELLERFRYITGGVDVVILFFLSPDIIEQREDSKGATYLGTEPTKADTMFGGIHALSVLTARVKMSQDDDLNALSIQPFGAKEALPGLLSSCTRGILSGELKKPREWQKKKNISLIPPGSAALPPPPGAPSLVQQVGKMPFPIGFPSIPSQAPLLPPNMASETASDIPLKQQVAPATLRADRPRQTGTGPQPANAPRKNLIQRAPPPPISKNPPMLKYKPLPKGWQDTLPAVSTRPPSISPASRVTLTPPPLSPLQRALPTTVNDELELKQPRSRKAAEVTRTEISSGRGKQGYEAKLSTKKASHACAPYRTGPVSAVMNLLPYCTTQTKLLSKTEVVSLSDVAGSLQEVVLLALRDGAENEEMGGLEGALGADGANGVREFWGDEWVID